jgi:glutaredoxin
MSDLLHEKVLTIFTQPNCQPCEAMKAKLRLWGEAFVEYDITQNAAAKNFLKISGHKTVPQLYFKTDNINADIDAVNLTIENVRKYYV